jgi:uncharacterized protein YdaU (DUF1376 family)
MVKSLDNLTGTDPVVHTEPSPDQATTGEVDMATIKSSKFAAFQFYPRDFLTSDKVARMSLEETGVYITLLCYAWLGKGLPPEPEQLARMLRMPLGRFKKVWAGVLSECFVLRAGKLVNPRQEHQRKELIAYVESCAKGGERSAETRRNRYGTSQPRRSDLRSDIRSESELTPNTSSSSAIASSSAKEEHGDGQSLFGRFSAAYPAHRRKGGRLVEGWFCDGLAAVGYQALFEALEQHKKSAQWADSKLVPGMDTWLREHRWTQVLVPASETPAVADKWPNWKPS